MTTLSRPKSPIWQPPSTRIGRWAVGLGVTFVIASFINNTLIMALSTANPDAWWRQAILPYWGIALMLFGLVSGVLALFALTLKHERSWMVWLTLLPWASAIIFLLGEFLIPH